MSAILTKQTKAENHVLVVEEGQSPPRKTSENVASVQIGTHIHFDSTALDSFDVEGCARTHYDLFVLCAAVEFADRRWKRPLTWHRIMKITLPVADLKGWQKPDVQNGLQDVLGHLTGDTWIFTFVQAKNQSPIGSRQLPLYLDKTKKFAVAYSNGLDSRAVAALSGDKTEALCIRIAGNYQRPKSGDNYFTQIPFKVINFRGRESSFRSRGFKFAAVTAIAAQLSNVARIVVPESGQGALGPVLLPLYQVYPDYRNYPTFFRKMERFIKALQNYQINYEQPRLWATKGETLNAFLHIEGKSKENLIETRSCWQSRRVVNVGGKAKQCGLCAACLLRRLSMHAAGISEHPNTYVVEDLSTASLLDALSGIQQKSDRDIMVEYGSVGVRHLHHLAVLAHLPDDNLRVFASEIGAATRNTYEETLHRLRNMLTVHAEEWEAFLASIGEHSFLTTWLDGGRHG